MISFRARLGALTGLFIRVKIGPQKCET